MHWLRTITIIGLLWCGSIPAQASHPTDSSKTREASEILREMAPLQADEVLWLARCIYSESDRPNEQFLVAWVVRNRVETAYRGKNYRDVVLEFRQFSAFNTPSPRRDFILTLNQNSTHLAWQEALQIALDVYRADSLARPFPITTRHFFSPVSMTGIEIPDWDVGGAPIDPDNLNIDPQRFRFYDGIDDPPEWSNPAWVTHTPSDRITTFRERRKPSFQARTRRSLKSKIPRPNKPTTQPVLTTK